MNGGAVESLDIAREGQFLALPTRLWREHGNGRDREELGGPLGEPLLFVAPVHNAADRDDHGRDGDKQNRPPRLDGPRRGRGLCASVVG